MPDKENVKKLKKGQKLPAEISDPQTRSSQGVTIVGGGDPHAKITEGVKIVRQH